MKGAAAGMAIGGAIGGIHSAYVNGGRTFGGAIENIFASFKEAFSYDSNWRKGTVTIEELNSSGQVTDTFVSQEAAPGGLSLANGCGSSCIVPPGSGSLFYASTSDIYARDNRRANQRNADVALTVGSVAVGGGGLGAGYRGYRLLSPALQKEFRGIALDIILELSGTGNGQLTNPEKPGVTIEKPAPTRGAGRR